MFITALTEKKDLLKELLESEVPDAVCVPEELFSAAELSAWRRRLRDAGKQCIFALPHVFRGRTAARLEKSIEEMAALEPDAWLLRSLDEAAFLAEKKIGGQKIFDAGIYSWSRRAVRELKADGADLLTAPLELNASELSERGLEDSELVVYGYYPAMLSAGCLHVTRGGCVRKEKSYTADWLTDRTGARFPVVNHCRDCYNIIYNSVPVWLLDEPGLPARIRFEFTIEGPGEAARILSDFAKGDRKPGRRAFTRGHYRRGVE